MGGLGSGHRGSRVGKKRTTTQCHQLSINDIKPLLKKGQETILYRFLGSDRELKIIWQPMFKGKQQRPWLGCPSCEKKVGVLYSHLSLKTGKQSHLACRECHELVYLQQQQSKCWRKYDSILKKVELLQHKTN